MGGPDDGPGGGPAGLPPGQLADATWTPSHYGKVPQLERVTWRLSVGGATHDGGTTLFDAAALDQLPKVVVEGGRHCVDRGSVLGLRWGGVRFRDLVEVAPPDPGARHVLLAAARGYSAAVLLEDLLHPDALVATEVDGQPLRREHGWPARAVLPHLYGFKGPKWLVEVTYHHMPRRGYWEARGIHPRGRVAQEERWAHQG